MSSKPSWATQQDPVTQLRHTRTHAHAHTQRMVPWKNRKVDTRALGVFSLYLLERHTEILECIDRLPGNCFKINHTELGMWFSGLKIPSTLVNVRQQWQLSGTPSTQEAEKGIPRASCLAMLAHQ